MKAHNRIVVTLIPAFLAILVAVDQARGESNVRKRRRNGEVVASEREEQEAKFNHYFKKLNLKYETEFAKLKRSAQLPKWRIPYAASIHPERGGGLSAARTNNVPVLRKYDAAFNKGKDLAYRYDRQRKLRVGSRRVGLFGGYRTFTYYDAEHWEGYCSGFTASTIMHPEPVRSVDASKVGGRPGVVFHPADIKALLSAVYNRTRKDSYMFVAPASAWDGGANMGTFHLALTNYIGNAGHPVGIDRTKGRVSWNNPVYSYSVISVRDAGRRGDVHYKEVRTKITYTWYGEDHTKQTDLATGDRINHKNRSMTIRYFLELDPKGKIIGGRALSHQGHFLWVPLYAVQGIRNQTSPGNPHVTVARVLALARESALASVQKKYDKVVIGQMVDPQIAVRARLKAEAEAKRLRALAIKAEKERKAREARALAVKVKRERLAAAAREREKKKRALAGTANDEE